jgi:hypothetical protein
LEKRSKAFHNAIATKNGLLILSIFTWDNKDQTWIDDNEPYM